MLSNIVHALGAYLHFHPFIFRSEHSDVEALIAIALRHAEPVTQSFWVGLIHIGDDGVDLPALLFLLFQRRVEDDADGKEVVDALEAALLLLHLLPDGVDALGAPLDMKFQSSLFEPCLDRSDEAVDVSVARLFGGVELFLDHIIGIVLEVFEREVLQLTLQRVESELMGQRRIEIAGLFRYLVLCLPVRRVANLPHDIHPVGDHNKDHAHILGEAQEQVAEVLTLDDGVFLIEFLYADESMDDTSHVVAESLANLFHSLKVIAETAIEHRGDDTVAPQSYLVDGDACCLQGGEDRIQSEDITMDSSLLDCLLDESRQALLVAGHQAVGELLLEIVMEFLGFC